MSISKTPGMCGGWIGVVRAVAISVWAAGAVWGESSATNQLQSATETALPDTHSEYRTAHFIDTVQGRASKRIVSVAQWVDSFFDDPEYAEEEADARASLQQNVKFYRNLDPEFSTRVRASVVLPNLNRRFRLSFEGNDDLYTEGADATPEDTLADSTQGSVDDPSLRLLYLFLQHRDVDLGLSGGIRMSDPALYTGPRLKLRSGIGAGWEAKVTQRVYWYTTNDLKSKSELRLDHLLGKRNLFRQAFRTDWDEEKHATEGFHNTATSSVTQPLERTAAMRYAWSSTYLTRPDPRWTSTTLSVGYRQSIWRKWIILEATPFVTWEEEYDWNPKAGLLFSFSTILDNE